MEDALLNHTHWPLYYSRRTRVPQRWPLVLRFVRGAVHGDIFLPVLLHTLFAAAVVAYDRRHPEVSLNVPTSLIPSLSIVVGLILVFRNSTSYDRWWTGEKHMSSIITVIRSLARSFLVSSRVPGGKEPTQDERQDTEEAIRLLLAFAGSIKVYLRQEWGGKDLGELEPDPDKSPNAETSPAVTHFPNVLPKTLTSLEDHGLGQPIQISCLIEAYIMRATHRQWLAPPQAVQDIVQLNNAIAAFGQMETIRLTPIPIAYLIHIKQVLALFGCFLPFAMVSNMKWWAVFFVSLITFALYGIEGIGAQLEDPFGHDKNDINMDATIEDLRVEVMILLEQWKTKGSLFNYAS